MKKSLSHILLRKLNVTTAIGLVVLMAGVTATSLFAAATANFQFTVNPGNLSIDIVDDSYATIGLPAVVFSEATMSFTCDAVTGTFGEATQQIYVVNPDAADGGWVMSLAADSPDSFWDSSGTDVDFNDPATTGCTDTTADADDTDTLAGQLTVDPSVGGGAVLAIGECASCATTGITQGSSAKFDAVAGTAVNSITLLTAAAGSDDIGDWTLSGIDLSQTIPAETPSASDYNIDMTLSVVAVG